ncbi:GNAT family N-acetyltransferase [Bacteriovorax sp. PP10]|jgi:RimJ/RimL family protein N-acetyltransferase|uniref:GNAT family N-acetyltransferase n=1 Tax=Bacteriovorax antarcticus TaxID=3088717 RepID=A0ABU5VR64_9BACT|nr:GNAT family N-acetyltransferase [Bacteriovorax sp. PP10]MEA9355543.1 GNAT family N-acetyltransferase [Bacteriovorax sp. PP10]
MKNFKNFEFKKLSHEDIPLVHEWMTSPHVREFWTEKAVGNFSNFKKTFEGKIASKKLNPYIVFLQGKPIGYIQSYVVDEKTFGIHQFIGVEEFVDKGLGSMFVKEFTDELLTSKKITRIITDPSVLNLRAQKAYEKAGFKKVKNADENIVMMEKKIKKAS